MKAIEFKNGQTVPITTNGDIIVYHSPLRQQQIIHRVVAKISASDGVFLLTKGDNARTNKTLDADCGAIVQQYYPGSDVSYIQPEKPCITPYPINASSIDGASLARIPWIGYVKLLLFDDIPKLLTGKSAGV